jgi:CRISPR-associated endoribonuclease Cas6
MDLLSLVISLTPLQPSPPATPLPRWWGRAAHALLLNTVRRYDPTLAETLHSEQKARPFTASTLMGRFPAGALEMGGSYTLRLTAFQRQLAEILLSAAQPNEPLAIGAEIELDYHPFRILALQPKPQSALHNSQSEIRPPQSPWAALTSYQALSAPYLLAKIAPPRRISLQFTSPTAFKSGGMHLPLPLPELVFNSLLERWNAYAPVLFPPEVRRYAAECLAVSRFKLSSRVTPVKSRGIQMGAVGEITYASLNYDRYWMSVITTLAEFARFSGVGAGVSMGLGQCRRVQDTPPPGDAPEE